MEAAYMTTPCERSSSMQFVYPAGAAIYPTAIPITASDPRAYEVIPHRVFVGGFQAATTELELRTFFEQFGHVREAKVIRSNEGASKGYGFITFNTEEEAKQVMRRGSEAGGGSKLELNGRKLNLGPAVRRLVHSPRYMNDFAYASPYGAYTYAYPPSPVVMMQPPQMQPSFLYSPSAVSATQFQFPPYESVPSQPHMVPAITPHNSPRNGIVGTQSAPLNGATATSVALQQINSVLPLTPNTPSLGSHRMAVIPQGTTFCAQQPNQQSDMTHYSQITPQMYCYASNAYTAADGGSQPLATSTPVARHPSMTGTHSQGNLQQFYGDVQGGAWHNTAAEQQALDIPSSGATRRSPLKDVSVISKQFSQMGIQQQYDVQNNNSPQKGTGGQSKRY